MGQGYVYQSNDKLYLVRCPDCGRENYAMAVSSGACAWCGYKALASDVRAEELDDD